MKAVWIALLVGITLSPSAGATFTDELKNKLDEKLDQNSLLDDIKGSARFLRSRVFSMGLDEKARNWITVLESFSSQDPELPLLFVAPKKLEDETEEEFLLSQRLAEKAHEEREELRANLLDYFQKRFSGTLGTSDPAMFDLVLDGPEVSDLEMPNLVLDGPEVSDSEAISAGPTLTLANLYLNWGEKIEGWDVFSDKQFQKIRGANGYFFLDGEVEVGLSSNNRTMQALTDPVLSRIPLYQVNTTPIAVRSNSNPELNRDLELFFEGLPEAVLNDKNETWVGYKYIFYRDSLIDTEIYSDLSTRKPHLVFLMKKVKPEVGLNYLLSSEDRKKMEKKSLQERERLDLVHEAIEVGKKAGPGNRQTARALMKVLADLGIARAQNEVAKMYRDSFGGPALPEEAARYEALATAQGMPSLNTQVSEMQPVDWLVPIGLEGEPTQLLLDLAMELKDFSSLRDLHVGVRKHERARILLKLLAEDGLAEAQFEVSKMFRDALGGPRDMDEALRFERLASAQGYPPSSRDVPAVQEEEDVPVTGRQKTKRRRTERAGGVDETLPAIEDLRAPRDILSIGHSRRTQPYMNSGSNSPGY